MVHLIHEGLHWRGLGKGADCILDNVNTRAKATEAVSLLHVLVHD
jgi:hypothetical protein